MAGALLGAEDSIDCPAPVSSHTTTRTQQPATSFKGQPEGGKGILETDRQAAGRQKRLAATEPSGHSAWRCDHAEETVARRARSATCTDDRLSLRAIFGCSSADAPPETLLHDEACCAYRDQDRHVQQQLSERAACFTPVLERTRHADVRCRRDRGDRDEHANEGPGAGLDERHDTDDSGQRGHHDGKTFGLSIRSDTGRTPRLNASGTQPKARTTRPKTNVATIARRKPKKRAPEPERTRPRSFVLIPSATLMMAAYWGPTTMAPKSPGRTALCRRLR